MKTIEKIYEYSITMHQAEDGRLFRSPEECREYEKTDEMSLRIAFKEIPKVETTYDELHMTFTHTGGETVYIVKPANMDEVKIINGVLSCGLSDGDTPDYILKEQDIGERFHYFVGGLAFLLVLVFRCVCTGLPLRLYLSRQYKCSFLFAYFSFVKNARMGFPYAYQYDWIGAEAMAYEVERMGLLIATITENDVEFAPQSEMGIVSKQLFADALDVK